MIKIHDVIFDENNQYQLHEIDVVQFINESFLNNNILKISQNNFTKFIEIEFDNENELFKLKSTKIIVVDSLKTKKTINKKNIWKYLSSSISIFLKERNIS